MEVVLYRNQKMNFSVSIYSVIYKNTIILSHSLVIIVVLIVVLDVPVNWHLLQIVPAFGLTWIAMICFGYLIALICVRYRDIVQIITTWFTVLFFITPVMWKPDFLPGDLHLIVEFNPLAQFLEILRNPLGAAGQLPCLAYHHGDCIWRRAHRPCCDRPLSTPHNFLDVSWEPWLVSI
jgi:ABC-type polysaccharide/polyol phosphate export permease